MDDRVTMPERPDVVGRVARRLNKPAAGVAAKVTVRVVRTECAASTTAPGCGLEWAPVLFVNPALSKAALLVTPGRVRLSAARWPSIAAALDRLPPSSDRPMACAEAPPTFAFTEAFLSQVLWAAALRHAGAQRPLRAVLLPAARLLRKTLRARVLGNPARELAAVLGVEVQDDNTADICGLLGRPAGVLIVRQLNRGPDTDDAELRDGWGAVAARIAGPGRVRFDDFWAAVSVEALLSIGVAMASDARWTAVFEAVWPSEPVVANSAGDDDAGAFDSDDSGERRDTVSPGGERAPPSEGARADGTKQAPPSERPPRVSSQEREKLSAVLKTARNARLKEIAEYGDSITLDNAPLCITAALQPGPYPRHAKRFTLGVIIATAVRLADKSPAKIGLMRSLVEQRFEAHGWNRDQNRGAIVARVIEKTAKPDGRPCTTYDGTWCPFAGNADACAQHLGIAKRPPGVTAAQMWALASKDREAGDGAASISKRALGGAQL